MAEVIKDIGLSPEKLERIKAAQKKHSVIDPGCEKLTPEEFINWHPINGISWEERARLMEAAGITENEEYQAMEIELIAKENPYSSPLISYT